MGGNGKEREKGEEGGIRKESWGLEGWEKNGNGEGI